MTTENELNKEINSLRVFCKHNLEANDRLNKIDFLIDKKEDELKTQVLDKIDELDFSITAHSLGIKKVKQEWQDKHNKEVKEMIKIEIKEIFER